MSPLRSASWWLLWVVGGAVAAAILLVASFIAIGGGVSLVGDPDVLLAGPLASAAALVVAFAAAGAGLGLVQWRLVRRRVPASGAWVGAMVVGMATVALLHSAIVALLGEAAAEGGPARVANEVAHNVAAGLLAGWIQWRFVVSRTRATRAQWLGVQALAFPLAGFAAWGAEAALALAPGDAAPLGLLFMGLVTGLGWRRAVGDEPATGAPRESEGPSAA